MNNLEKYKNNPPYSYALRIFSKLLISTYFGDYDKEYENEIGYYRDLSYSSKLNIMEKVIFTFIESNKELVENDTNYDLAWFIYHVYMIEYKNIDFDEIRYGELKNYINSINLIGKPYVYEDFENGEIIIYFK